MVTVESAIQSNQTAISHVLDILRAQLGGDLTGKRIAIWGIAFKAGTDDTRDSPALEVARRIMKEGATVTAFDPLAQAPIGLQITQSPSALEACEDSNALVVLTEWPEFAEIKPEDVKSVFQNPAAILDTRRILDQTSWSKVFSSFKAVGGS